MNNSQKLELQSLITEQLIDITISNPIKEETINKTIELVKELMAKYNIPVGNVIRHYDVTHKVCPAPFVNNSNRWNDFKSTRNYTRNYTKNYTRKNNKFNYEKSRYYTS